MARPAMARETRTPLSRERVLGAAVALADQSGIGLGDWWFVPDSSVTG
jgi:hypothetical protein